MEFYQLPEFSKDTFLYYFTVSQFLFTLVTKIIFTIMKSHCNVGAILITVIQGDLFLVLKTLVKLAKDI